MKVHLMFRDQDFNPKQDLPVNAQALIKDLELDTLFRAMAEKDGFIYEIVQSAILCGTTDPDTIRYRQDILKDCLNYPDVIRNIYQIPIDAFEQKRRHWFGIFTQYPSGVLSSAVDIMEMFVIQLKKLRSIADEYANQVVSEGLVRLLEMLKTELNDEYFALMEFHLKQLKFREGVLISADLGRGLEGNNYTLRLPENKSRNWIKEVFSRKDPVFSFLIPDRDEAGSRALSDLRDKGIYAAANALAQSADHIENFLKALQIELAFYVGCLNLRNRLISNSNPICIPTIKPLTERVHNFQGLYDVSLALTLNRTIIGNELNADRKTLVMITGANQGGKSTFLRSIGLAQLMMQAGMFVPAEQFSANLCQGIFTHYKRKEDVSMRMGKLDEELQRMSEIVDQISPNALILFNESFAATNEREGSEIARQITTALLDSKVKVFFVTHMFEFARICYENRQQDAIFLRAERQTGGQRTFKIKEGKPLPTSYGEDVYRTVFGANQ